MDKRRREGVPDKYPGQMRNAAKRKGWTMKLNHTKIALLVLLAATLALGGCATSYKAQPLPFKAPNTMPNAVPVEGALVAAKAFSDPNEAREIFGFDILGAGLLPVQVVFDNRGESTFIINGSQTFLEDVNGNIWPILTDRLAYERATKYAQTGSIVKKGAYNGLLGAAAGSIIGAAIGVVTGGDVAEALGRGAAVGAAAGATMGGISGYGDREARNEIIGDLKEKSLQNKPVEPHQMAHGILFFPAETAVPRQLRLSLTQPDINKTQILTFSLLPYPAKQ